jgi:hypothetical protein
MNLPRKKGLQWLAQNTAKPLMRHWFLERQELMQCNKSGLMLKGNHQAGIFPEYCATTMKKRPPGPL